MNRGVHALAIAVAIAGCSSNEATSQPTVDAGTPDTALDKACGSNGDCPMGGSRCWFAISDGCAAKVGRCLYPVDAGTACKAKSYCSCKGTLVSDCTAPDGYFSQPIAPTNDGCTTDGERQAHDAPAPTR